MSLPFLKSHQIVGKVEGYCFDVNNLGVVYDVKPLDTIYRIMSDNGHWIEKTDVYTFWVVLLELIMRYTSLGLKRAIKTKHNFALAQCVCGGYGEELEKALNGEMTHILVHACFQRDPDYDADDGTKLSLLALRCVQPWACRRPTMQQVVGMLEELHVVIKHCGMP
ncbi:hypothetical protein Salat_1036500 [Sesamum alatum]|uniref:Uncharacterized protein n=1 Tax=Sesamum alatum TaxID=300844 RepID=A0AAE1YMS8_9LAMI|nr:hypothetical protein Salat_1036500 [Sesamum alatum]